MSQENVEVVLDQFAAVNERDFPRAMNHYAEHVELVVAPEAFLESGTFSGRDAVEAVVRKLVRHSSRATGSRSRGARPGRFRSADPAHSGRGRASGIEVHGETGYLYGLRDGKIIRAELFPSAETARQAAGLGD